MDGADGRERRCRSSRVLPSHLSHTVIRELFDSKGSYTRAATAVDDTLTPCSNHGDADNLRCLLDDILERRRVIIYFLATAAATVAATAAATACQLRPCSADQRQLTTSDPFRVARGNRSDVAI